MKITSLVYCSNVQSFISMYLSGLFIGVVILKSNFAKQQYVFAVVKLWGDIALQIQDMAFSGSWTLEIKLAIWQNDYCCNRYYIPKFIKGLFIPPINTTLTKDVKGVNKIIERRLFLEKLWQLWRDILDIDNIDSRYMYKYIMPYHNY